MRAGYVECADGVIDLFLSLKVSSLPQGLRLVTRLLIRSLQPRVLWARVPEFFCVVREWM